MSRCNNNKIFHFQRDGRELNSPADFQTLVYSPSNIFHPDTDSHPNKNYANDDKFAKNTAESLVSGNADS
jgi:hypothetical protein